MLTAQGFAQQWGTHELFRVPPEMLDGVNILETAKVFLIEAGLPHRAMFSYHFTFSPLPLETERPPRGGMKHRLVSLYPGSSLRLLSHWQADDPWYYSSGVIPYLYNAIEEETGQIWRVEDGTGPVELIHSSLPQYAAALLAYRDYIRHFEQSEPEAEQKMRLLQNLERRLRSADPYALADPPAIEQLYALWGARQFPSEAAQRAVNQMIAEEIPLLNPGPQRFWPRALVDMEIHV